MIEGISAVTRFFFPTALTSRARARSQGRPASAALAATRRAESDWARGPQGATGATCGQFLPNISGHPRRRYGEPKGLTAWDQDFDQFVTPRAQQFAFPKIRV
jgi:hypothetical protein